MTSSCLIQKRIVRLVSAWCLSAHPTCCLVIWYFYLARWYGHQLQVWVWPPHQWGCIHRINALLIRTALQQSTFSWLSYWVCGRYRNIIISRYIQYEPHYLPNEQVVLMIYTPASCLRMTHRLGYPAYVFVWPSILCKEIYRVLHHDSLLQFDGSAYFQHAGSLHWRNTFVMMATRSPHNNGPSILFFALLNMDHHVYHIFWLIISYLISSPRPR